MKKFLLTLMVAVFAVGAMSAQTAKKVQATPVAIEKKHECKDHKDGQPCNKPADQQCDDCKAKAAAAQKCEKAEGMKHECKKGEGHECKEGMAPKHECKKGEGHECKDGMAPKHECKKGEGHECKEGMAPKHECKEGHKPECKNAEAANLKKHEECKDHKDGQPCNKPADQQCPDCKEKAKKN